MDASASTVPQVALEVRLGDQLLSGQPTQMDALHVAEALAHAAAVRGVAARAFQPGQFYRLQNYETLAPRADGWSGCCCARA